MKQARVCGGNEKGRGEFARSMNRKNLRRKGYHGAIAIRCKEERGTGKTKILIRQRRHMIS